MEDSTSTETIFNRLAEERKTGELLPLPEDFYKKLGRAQESAGSDNAAKQEENRAKLINTLRNKRTQKILTYVAYGRQLPRPVPAEDEALYRHIKRIVDEQNGASKTTKIRILTSTPELITTTGKRVGPFEQNQILETDNESEIDFIISNKIGEVATQ